jgi:hypothetical protein
MSFVDQCKQELLESEEALRLFEARAKAGAAYWASRIATLRNAVKIYGVAAPQLPDVPETSIESVEVVGEDTASTDVEATTEASNSTEAEDTPSEVETGRGGRPKLLSSMCHVLTLYGPMHPETMNSKIVELGLQSNSKKPVDYIRFALSKNKELFEKVPGQRGMWRVRTTNGKATSVRPIKPEDESQPAEITKVKDFRESEKTGVRLGLEEAQRLVEEITDPRNVLEGTSTFSIPPL